MKSEVDLKKIESLVKPFVDLGIYDSPEKFIRDMIVKFVTDRISYYEKIIERFESKYKISFSKFTKRLKGKATPKLEDDWMEWESAINMLETWKRAIKRTGTSAS